MIGRNVKIFQKFLLCLVNKLPIFSFYLIIIAVDFFDSLFGEFGTRLFFPIFIPGEILNLGSLDLKVFRDHKATERKAAEKIFTPPNAVR